MSITLELTDEEEAALREAAQQAGVDVVAYIKERALEPFRRVSSEWELWERVGQVAAEDACDTLMERGIGYVYGREGKVYRRLPDGTEALIEPKES